MYRGLYQRIDLLIFDGLTFGDHGFIFGDNLYCYGPVEGPITEDLPSRAQGPNGRTRAAIAEMLAANMMMYECVPSNSQGS